MRRSRAETLSIALFALVVPVSAEDLFCPRSSSQPTETAAVALVNGRPILQGELDDRMRDRQSDYENRIYQSRLTELNALIDELLFMQDASQHGSSGKEYVDILAAKDPITSSEVDTLYKQIEPRLKGVSPIDAKRQLQRELVEMRKRRAYELTIRQLRANARVQVLLTPPVARTVHVVTTGMEPTLGPADPKLTIIEFSDFQCPYCKQIQAILDQVMANNPRAIRLVFKHLPLPAHEAARTAAAVGFCAQQQRAFWDYKDRVFSARQSLTQDAVLDAGRAVVNDQTALDNCIASGTADAQIASDVAEARRLGIDGTPALVLNGRVIRGMVTADALQHAVSEVLLAESGKQPLKQSPALSDAQ